MATGKKDVDPLPPADRIKRLYASLVAQVDGGHWKGAERTCDKILRIDPTDADAIQTKLFIYLQKEEYQKALELIDEEPPLNAESKPKLFEKAYALYRLKREADAEAILVEIRRNEEMEADEEEERGVMHLEAQLNYRQGKYQAAYVLYQQLLDTTDPSSEEHHDVQINLQAAQTYLDFLNSGYLQAIDHTLASSPSTATGLKDIENFPPPTIPSHAVTFSIPSTSASEKGPATHEGRTKVRVKRLPKGVVPGVTPPPDPERWIKKSQRSNRPMHGKKAKSRASGATQGFTTEAPVPSGTNGGTGSGSASGGKGRKKK
ncbi:hypothetical protein EV368DRAFT_41947 [Lentinula lateritia]|uniref:Uncharacterized protein n=1 Tax=Lentinula aff. lateritia TaxID=2804960 RepID=A0ACC1TTG8_9AGAR|nr:hypothetical protein F5876DRAFT_79356 [Lentinula aff. lateritia]KAJ3851986.1 hypothetical protein EV368DRAFT_41947 [Lentinula lateritia]